MATSLACGQIDELAPDEDELAPDEIALNPVDAADLADLVAGDLAEEELTFVGHDSLGNRYQVIVKYDELVAAEANALQDHFQVVSMADVDQHGGLPDDWEKVVEETEAGGLREAGSLQIKMYALDGAPAPVARLIKSMPSLNDRGEGPQFGALGNSVSSTDRLCDGGDESDETTPIASCTRSNHYLSVHKSVDCSAAFVTVRHKALGNGSLVAASADITINNFACGSVAHNFYAIPGGNTRSRVEFIQDGNGSVCADTDMDLLCWWH